MAGEVLPPGQKLWLQQTFACDLGKSITLFSLSFFLCQVETTPTSQGCCMDQEITMANRIYSFRNRHCSALHVLTHVTPHKITPACTEHEATTQWVLGEKKH